MIALHTPPHQESRLLKILNHLVKSVGIFFIIAPFYWIPTIPQEAIWGVRAILLATITILTSLIIIKTRGKIFSVKSIAAFLIALTVTTTYTLAFYEGGGLNLVITLFYIAIFATAGYCAGYFIIPLHTISRIEVTLILMFSVLCLAVLISRFIPAIDTINPLYANALSLKEFISTPPLMSSTGFNLGRTGWAISVFFVAMYFLLFAINTPAKKIKYLLFFSAHIAFLSIFTTGSRGGVIYIFIFILAWIANRKFENHFYLWLSGVLVVCALAMVYFLGGDYFRISNNEDLSNGRLDGYFESIKILSDNFVFGTFPNGGYSLKEHGLEYDHVHNAWLNTLINYGAAMMIPFFIYFAKKTIVALNTKQNNKSLYPAKVILIAGIISTFLEPESIFSNGHHTLVFWATLGFLLGVKSSPLNAKIGSGIAHKILHKKNQPFRDFMHTSSTQINTLSSPK